MAKTSSSPTNNTTTHPINLPKEHPNPPPPLPSPPQRTLMEVKSRTTQTLSNRMIHPTSTTNLNETIAEIRFLTKHDPQTRILLAESNAISLLAHHLLSPPPTASPSSLENASAALLNISISSREALISNPSLLNALTHSLSPSAPAPVAQNAATTVLSLLSVKTHRATIGSKKPLIAALISLISAQGCDARTVKDALKALYAVAICAANRSGMVQAGAVPALFSLVAKDCRAGVVEDAVAVIALVAGCGESWEAFRAEDGVRVLVDLMRRERGASGRVVENAVSALVDVAVSGGETAVVEMREMEEVEAVVREMKEGGIGVRAREKAEILLNVWKMRRAGSLERNEFCL